ncbi:uncharacterized protein LOC129909520 [Episyrphus balteatus]|uniref:uncharacterized protein LOC129909520 n=1 Tax=Episyrphus balteatus TaxID=286459 RepID=UPI0024855BC8|nr:uncharacterized protein LOC129909520 [Episyrphus balteatus]
MYNIEYVESEKVWCGPRLDVKPTGLGEAILKILKERDPEQIYEIFHDNGTHVTNKEIREKTITAAQNLLNLGVKKGDVVVFFTYSKLNLTPLSFACYTIGAPVCYFDIHINDVNIPEYFVKLDPTVIVYEEKFKSMVFNGIKGLTLPKLKHILSFNGKGQNSIDDLIFKPPVDIENFQIPNIGNPDYLPANLAFTSGSTGLPKIVMLSHSMMIQGPNIPYLGKQGSVSMVLSEIRWIAQIISMLQPAFNNETRVYSSIVPPELTSEMARNMVDAHKVTHYAGVPAFFLGLLEAAEKSNEPSTLSSLKFALLVGENIGDACEGYFARITPNCKIVRFYGMTEVVGGIASSAFDSRDNVNGGVLRSGFKVKIIDKNQKLLGHNEIGQICVKTSHPFLGYLKDKKANEETFIEDGWLNTGDLGMFDSDNLLNVFSREKYVLHYSDGKILMPNIIENIVNNFEGVRSSVLVGRPSKENSKEDVGTIFVVFKNPSHSIDVENNLRDYLKKKLTKEQMKIIKYLKVLEELPKTTCSKVDRIALKEMLNGGAEI